MKDITLQVNLSAGDAAYAHLTVPPLLAAHPDVYERLLIVDACKPQRTRIVDPALRYPEPAFSERIARVSALARNWLAAGLVDRIEWLNPGDIFFSQLRRRYLRSWVSGTHDYGGCAMMAYLAAFELCGTRYLLHYDADMLLYQQSDYDWAAVARAEAQSSPAIAAVIPRPSPPDCLEPDAPSRHEALPLLPHRAGWLNTWFSTRCFFFDLQRLQSCLPLLQGVAYWDSLAAKILWRGFPRSPEALLHRRLGAAGLYRLHLHDRRAWLLHPVKKDNAFVSLLPRILDAVRSGRCPEGQRGRQDLQPELWAHQTA